MAIVAGILVGIGLVIEFRPLHEQCVQPTTFQDATAALPFLQDHGGTIRMAVLVGSVNAALGIIMVADARGTRSAGRIARVDRLRRRHERVQ